MDTASLVIHGILQIPTGAHTGYVLTSDTSGNASWGSTSSLVGPQGNQGFQGNQGTAGSSGGTGATGNQGNQGFQGNQGVAGSNGGTGSTGNQGNQGFQGNQGTAGSSGGTGSTGNQGNQGFQGNQGTAGSSGGTGSTGNQGNQGFQGNQGTAGSSGGTGSTGNQGNQGFQGFQGNQGTAGSNGGTGSTGNQGNQGFQGFQGPAGSGTGSSTPGGSDGQIQYNNAGAFAGFGTYENGNVHLTGGLLTNSGGRSDSMIQAKFSSTKPYFALTGAGGLSTDGGNEGIAFGLSFNDTGNRQLQIGTTDGANSDPTFRYGFYSGYAFVDGVTKDATAHKAITIGNSTSVYFCNVAAHISLLDSTTSFQFISYGGKTTAAFQVDSSQTSTNLVDFRANSGTTMSSIDLLGAMHPSHLADSSAQNDSLFYSTDGSEMVYKDSGGTIHSLGGSGSSVSIGGTISGSTNNEILYVNGSGNLAQSSSLYFNDSTGQVGIGGNTLYGSLTLTGNVPGGNAGALALYNSGGFANAAVSIDFYTTNANSGIPQTQLKAIDDGAFSTHLYFLTKNPGGASNPLTLRGVLSSQGSWILNNGTLATSAFDGFVYLPNCAGTPTGVPTVWSGVPMIYDTSNNILYAYNSTWQPLGLQGPSGTGSQGNQGFQGRQGNQGFQGRQGNQGVTGSGTQGFQGRQGFQGASGGGSGGTPASPSSSIQFNNGGAFGGTAKHTWDNTNNKEQIQAKSGQSTNIWEITNNGGGTVWDCVGPQGFMGIGATNPIATCDITSLDGGSIVLRAKGASSQTQNILEVQNNANSTLSYFDKDGYGFVRPIVFNLAAGTNATTGTDKTIHVIAERPGKIIKAFACAKTAPFGSSIIFDIKKNGTSIWNATPANRLIITSTATTGTQTSFDVTTFNEGDQFSIDIAQVGSSTPGKDIAVHLLTVMRNMS